MIINHFDNEGLRQGLGDGGRQEVSSLQKAG